MPGTYSINKFAFFLLICVCYVNTILSQNLRQEYYDCALELYDHKDYKEAVHFYDLVIASCPRDSMAYFDRAIAKELLHDYSGAINDYTQQIEIDSTNVDSYFLRGIANYMMGNYSSTIKDCSKTLFIEIDNYDAMYYRALANFKLNNLKVALQDLNTAIMFNPSGNPEYYFYRAEILFQLKEFKKSSYDCHKYLQLGGAEQFSFKCEN